MAALPHVQRGPREHGDGSGSTWMQTMVDRAEVWSRVVDECAFVESALDRRAGDAPPLAVRNFQCLHCDVTFPTDKARLQHMRVKHGKLCPFKERVGAVALCARCGTNFKQRFRLVAHLSDTRASRRGCGQFYLDEVPALGPDVTGPLNAEDAELQKKASALCHSHAIAVAPAVRASGKLVGLVRR